MASRAIREKPEPGALKDGLRTRRETAPSIMRAQDPRLARWLGLVGLMLVTLGSVALTATALGYASRISPVWGSFFSVTGLALLLFHATVDKDLQVRRTYGVLGYLWLAAGVLVTVLPLKGAAAGAHFLPWGFTCFLLALFFLLPFLRNETEPGWRAIGSGVLGLAGAILAAIGFIGGSISEAFLLGGEHTAPFAPLLILLGLAYLWSFVGLYGTSSDLGYRAGLGLGAVGLLFFLIALGRSVLPPLFYQWGWVGARPQPYLIPSGLIVMVLGALYVCVAAGLCSENRLLVLFRRELAAYFYSPIAYIVLLSFAVVSWFLFLRFLAILSRPGPEAAQIQEPVISFYLVEWFPVICVIFAVPLLTMRLLAEEQRTGSLEVLLTAPVGETTVVLSKFLAALVFYMLIWIPWGLCLIALRAEGGQPFEYRPLLSFYLMLLLTGAAFTSMGLFFSSLTRNQIISAVLTFMALLLLTVAFFFKQMVQSQAEVAASGWMPVVAHISYLDLWVTSALGEITPKFYVFPISATIFWLFLTVKVLESRKWR